MIEIDLGEKFLRSSPVFVDGTRTIFSGHLDNSSVLEQLVDAFYSNDYCTVNGVKCLVNSIHSTGETILTVTARAE